MIYPPNAQICSSYSLLPAQAETLNHPIYQQIQKTVFQIHLEIDALSLSTSSSFGSN